MEYLVAALLTVVNLFCLFLTALGLPGNWLMVLLAVLAAWWQRDLGLFDRWTLVAVVALAFVAEVVEFFAGAVGSKRAGGTLWGAGGALAGGIVGGIVGTLFIPLPILGTLLGVCVGAFGGAALLELYSGQTMEFSIRSGRGAAVGRLLGVLAKLLFGIAIWLTLAVAAFWP